MEGGIDGGIERESLPGGIDGWENLMGGLQLQGGDLRYGDFMLCAFDWGYAGMKGGL